MKKVSVLIPCYNEEASLPMLYTELVKVMDSCKSYDWEILFINDGSRDNTLSIIKNLRKMILEYLMLIYQEILEKKTLCLPVSIMLQVIV